MTTPLFFEKNLDPLWHSTHYPWDARRDLIVANSYSAALFLAAMHFISAARAALKARNAFHVALSGGSTPKAIYALLASDACRYTIDWTRVHLYWSDERAVPPDDADSNFHMAMSAGLDLLPIPSPQIFRMPADGDLAEGALAYEKLLEERLPDGSFDLVMLGMGVDGHTASLFPDTTALEITDRAVVSNYLPKQRAWRMTLTYPVLHRARQCIFYVLGESKAFMAQKALASTQGGDLLPAQKIGTEEHKALWLLDDEAASALTLPRKNHIC